MVCPKVAGVLGQSFQSHGAVVKLLRTEQDGRYTVKPSDVFMSQQSVVKHGYTRKGHACLPNVLLLIKCHIGF